MAALPAVGPGAAGPQLLHLSTAPAPRGCAGHSGWWVRAAGQGLAHRAVLEVEVVIFSPGARSPLPPPFPTTPPVLASQAPEPR